MLFTILLQVFVVPPPCGKYDYACRMKQASALVPDYNETQERQAAAREASARADLARSEARRSAIRERVGALVADGQCEEARKLALRNGNFALAAEVREACAAEK